MVRKEAWPFYRTLFGVRLRWELEQPKGPKGAGANCAVKLITESIPEVSPLLLNACHFQDYDQSMFPHSHFRGRLSEDVRAETL